MLAPNKKQEKKGGKADAGNGTEAHVLVAVLLCVCGFIQLHNEHS